MSYLIKATLTLGVLLCSQSVWAAEPCEEGVLRVTVMGGPFVALPPNVVELYGSKLAKDPDAIVEGTTVKVPNSIGPDTESLNKDGTLKEHVWHNLRNAQRPLRVICHYRDSRSHIVALSDKIDVCSFKPGKLVCQ
jgi:hypothetical protein